MRNRFNLTESDKIHIRNLHGIRALNESLFSEDYKCTVCDSNDDEWDFVDETPQNLTLGRRVCGEYKTNCEGPPCTTKHIVNGEYRGCCEKGALNPDYNLGFGRLKWFDDSRKANCMCYKLVDVSKCHEKEQELRRELDTLDKDPETQMAKQFTKDYEEYLEDKQPPYWEDMFDDYKKHINAGGTKEEFDKKMEKKGNKPVYLSDSFFEEYWEETGDKPNSGYYSTEILTKEDCMLNKAMLKAGMFGDQTCCIEWVKWGDIKNQSGFEEEKGTYYPQKQRGGGCYVNIK